MPPPELEPTPRSLTIWGKGKPCCLFFPQHCQKAHALRALRTTLTAGLGLRMPSDRPLPGAKVAACWILLSLCKYAPDLNLPAKGSCAEPNSKQFVLLPPLRFCVLEEALKKPVEAQKSEPFSPPPPPNKVLLKCGAAIRFNFLRSWNATCARSLLTCGFVQLRKKPQLCVTASRRLSTWKALCFGATAAFLRGDVPPPAGASFSLLARQRCGWCPGVNAPQAAGGERTPGCRYCFTKVGSPRRGPFSTPAPRFRRNY